MSTEILRDEDIVVVPDLPGFLNLVVEKFNSNTPFFIIEDVAKRLVKKEGMEHFEAEIPNIREKLKEFLGSREWEKIRVEESKRLLEGDRDIRSASGG